MKGSSQVQAEHTEMVGVKPSKAAVLPVAWWARRDPHHHQISSVLALRPERRIHPGPTVAEAKDNKRKVEGPCGCGRLCPWAHENPRHRFRDRLTRHERFQDTHGNPSYVSRSQLCCSALSLIQSARKGFSPWLQEAKTEPRQKHCPGIEL
ncbi:hypothetical protein AV530_001334 [Patagioenas fasciata monilis]|uniref:Uncharacterized protein n=1 Tax=Patagioenas fasciata monilis TaxID=372326 RepID=A0A1V4JQP1_PATFA|nr:hypothetical protein AV530_001334 [Patagioenas fasciata monilis]